MPHHATMGASSLYRQDNEYSKGITIVRRVTANHRGAAPEYQDT
jgi:hypothetical protein